LLLLIGQTGRSKEELGQRRGERGEIEMEREKEGRIWW